MSEDSEIETPSQNMNLDNCITHWPTLKHFLHLDYKDSVLAVRSWPTIAKRRTVVMFFLLSWYTEKISRRRKTYLAVIMQVVSVSSTCAYVLLDVNLTSSEMILLWKIRILSSLSVNMYAIIQMNFNWSCYPSLVDQTYLLWGTGSVAAVFLQTWQ